MKKIWTKPMATVEEFAANEYVAACGDQNTVYYFKCNAPRGVVYYYPESDGVIDGNRKKGDSKRLGGYKPCPAKHEAPDTGDFYDGFVDRNDNGICDSGENAIIWIEWRNSPLFGRVEDDWHATALLDMDSWQTAKS